MPRSSKVDAVEKFRFSVMVVNTAFDPINLVRNFTGFLRAGFSEVSLPKQHTNAIEYRENLDATHPQLGAGITRYEPMILKRGVTSSSDFFRWATQVHDSGSVIASAIQRMRGDAGDKPPSEDQNYRRDIIIIVYGRGGAVPTGVVGNVPGVNKVANIAGAAGLGIFGIGDVVKAIWIKEAWVTGFRSGDTLSAMEGTTKLIEELELRYESFEEITPEALITKAANLAAGLVTDGITSGGLF